MPLQKGMKLSTGDEVVGDVMTGGFSEVAEVNNEIAGRKAIKRLREDVLRAGGAAVVTQFMRECYVWLVKLGNAPYVARAIFPLPNLDNLGPVLFMEYVEGLSLRSLLNQCQRLSISQTRRLGDQIAQALDYAHKQKTQHRDLKPSNVLINRRNEVRIVDWGLCGAHDTPALAAFTPDYSSPERHMDPSLNDPKDDVWALGAVLYECLMGRTPGLRTDRTALRTTLLQFNPTLPEAMAGLIASMLAPDAAARPTAEQVAGAIGKASLISEVEKREMVSAFCRPERDEEGVEKGCGFVSAVIPEGTMRCPICGEAMYKRIPRPAPKGMKFIRASSFTHGLNEDQARIALGLAGMEGQARLVGQLAPKAPEQVFVPAFYIDEFPVTNAEFADFCAACNYPQPQMLVVKKSAWPNHPVVQVTWKDALCYSLWKGKRLPTDLEWEKAARGDKDARCYPWGNHWDQDRCNHNQTRDFNNIAPVSHFTQPENDGRSPFGVADMACNVREWVANGSDVDSRQLRGGSWSEPGSVYGLVTYSREAQIEFHDEGTGFRCVADIEYDEVMLK